MLSLKKSVLKSIVAPAQIGTDKVTIVGAGVVGTACAFALLTQNVTNEICLLDKNADKVKGEMLDLQHASCFLGNPKITGGTDFALSVKSRICIIAASEPRKERESMLEFAQRNTEVLRDVIPKLIEFSPKTILLIVTKPVDIMTYVAWKIAGIPISRVLGTGTTLDSIRFRFMLSGRLEISPISCNAWIIGEHGEKSVPIWPVTNVAGVRLREINRKVATAEDPENFNELYTQVVKCPSNLIKLKGNACWATSLVTASLTSAILNNSNEIYAVSTNAKGMHGIDNDVFLSLPCILSANGITDIVKQTLNAKESTQLRESAKMLYEIQRGISCRCSQ